MKKLGALFLSFFMFVAAFSQTITVSISGHVYTPDSLPLENVQIFAYPDDHSDSATVFTDENGYYSLSLTINQNAVYINLFATYSGCEDSAASGVVQLDTNVVQYVYDFVMCENGGNDDSLVFDSTLCEPLFYYFNDWMNPMTVYFYSVVPQPYFDSIYSEAEIDYGDGTIEAFNGEAMHVYAEQGVYTVTVLAYNTLCSDTASFSVEVFVFSLPDTLLCFTDFFYTLDESDSTGLTALFTAYSFPEENVTYTWDFGDGNTYTGSEDQVSHTYSEAGEYMVTLIMQTLEGCVDTVTQPVWVGCEDSTWFDEDDCQALFYTVYLGDNTVEFNDISWPGINGEITEYMWDLGDSTYSVVPNFSHTYADTGEYLVTLTIITDKGCTSSYSEVVYVGDYVDSSDCILFYPNEDDTLLSVRFYNLSLAQNASWIWDFGDAKKSYQVKSDIVTHQYNQPGNYTVTLTNSNTGEQYKMDIQVTDNHVKPLKGYAVRKSASGTTRVSEQSDNITLYPMPVSDVLNIEFSEYTEGTVELMTLLGQKIYQTKVQGTKVRLNLHSLNSGFYLIKVNGKTYKILKK